MLPLTMLLSIVIDSGIRTHDLLKLKMEPYVLQVCQSVTKKLSETTSSSKGTDGAAVDKRIRKTPEFALGQAFQVLGPKKLNIKSFQKVFSGELRL